MGRKLTLRGAWLLVALALWTTSVQAQSLVRIVPPRDQVAATRIDNILERATQFEQQRRWDEALSVYEEALRDFPQDATLGRRHVVAKLHCDLCRRYADPSFLRSLVTLDERQGLALYAEVLLKVESHYVQAPQFAELLSRGTDSLEIALAEPAFQRQHPQATAPAADSFLRQIRSLAASRAIHSRQQAVDFVSTVMQLGRSHLQLSPASVAMEYVCGTLGALDAYSGYLTSDQLNDVYSQIEGNFVGLGVEFKAGSIGLQVVNVITGSPAQRAGLRAGDRIVEVDGHATIELSTDQAADLLQGAEGSYVEVVAVSTAGASRRMSIRREHVEVPSVDDVKMIDPAAGIGYLKLTCFQKTTSRDLDAALWRLHREGMRSLIVDVRRNPGGLLGASVEVADKFVEAGTIVSTRGRSPLEDFNYTAKKQNTWRVPLVVLIDGDSASASEIFAGAIRDHRRGSLVGQRSYGKGSVQGIFPLAAINSGVRLTTAKFYSPSGHPISNVGVQPDIVVQRTAKPLDGQLVEAADDPELNAGIQAARQLMAQRR